MMSIQNLQAKVLKSSKVDFDTSLPMTWYPVCLSQDLKRQKHMKFNMFDEDWIAFRTKKGVLGVTARYCCHIGTDLSNGKVVNDCIECPMHGWQFDTRGICQHIPAQKKIPSKAQLKTLIVEEHFGIIFVFYNQVALFSFQEIFGATENLRFSAPKRVALETPACIVALNTFDAQHYRKVHSREFVREPEVTQISTYCLEFLYTVKVIKKRWVDYVIAKLTADETTVTIESWGGNLLLLRNKNTLYSSLVSIKPISDQKSIIYITAIKSSKKRNSFYHKVLDKLMLRIAVTLLKSYLSPDLKIIANIRPVNGVLLDGPDASLKHFFDYWQKLPKCSLHNDIGLKD